ncbi:MAG TPA: tetratricopeptide repeat protein [Sedimenticola sp.]|nr:tetratricopeptide repeat protein [Sedimenticola sp.]
MTAHLTEEEQVEALKKWWKENGKAAVAGVVLGLGGILGWQAWTQHQQTTAEQASAQFQQLLMAVRTGAGDSVIKQGELLISRFEDSTYAVFAALAMARQYLEQGDSVSARGRLAWALANSDDPSVQQIARLRLARLMLNEGDLEGAARLADEAPADNFAGEFAQLRGDIAMAGNDRESARGYYREALAKEVGNADLVRMKLDDLAVPAGTP